MIQRKRRPVKGESEVLCADPGQRTRSHRSEEGKARTLLGLGQRIGVRGTATEMALSFALWHLFLSRTFQRL